MKQVTIETFKFNECIAELLESNDYDYLESGKQNF